MVGWGVFLIAGLLVAARVVRLLAVLRPSSRATPVVPQRTPLRTAVRPPGPVWHTAWLLLGMMPWHWPSRCAVAVCGLDVDGTAATAAGRSIAFVWMFVFFLAGGSSAQATWYRCFRR